MKGDHNYLYVNIAASQPAPPPLSELGGSPYRGLDAFREDDSGIFFGRLEATREILDKLAERLADPGFLVVSGASGAGKSSLLQAGVLPRLREECLPDAPEAGSWPHLTLTPTARPLEELAKKVAKSLNDAMLATDVRRTLEEDPKEFALIAQQIVSAWAQGEDGRLILVVDQFEQLFTQCEDEGQRRAFIDALHAAATPRGPGEAPAALVVLVVRQDFEQRCQEYPEVAKALRDRRYLLLPMDSDELRHVIVGPAEKKGIRVGEELTGELLKEMAIGTAGAGSNPGTLPLLSYVLYQTWQKRKDSGSLTLRDYEETGGLKEAVARNAQQAYESLTDTQREVARQVFVMLTSVTADEREVSNPRTRAELAAGVKGAQPGDLETVFDAFSHPDRRLLTLSADSVAIAHEALIRRWPLLHGEWLSDDRDTRKILSKLREAAAEWERNERDSALLHRGTPLADAEAADARARADPTRFPRPGDEEETERRFLAASRRREQARARLRRRIITGLVTAVVALASSTILAVLERNNAIAERDSAISEALDTQSQAAGDSDPVQSRQKALAAWAIEPNNPFSGSTMLNAAANLQWDDVLNVAGSREGWAVFSPNGKYLAVRDDDGTHLWNAATHQELPTIPNGKGNGINSIAFNPDGKCLAAVSNDSIQIWGTTAPCKEMHGYTTPGAQYESVAFSRQGTLLAAEATDGSVHVWNTADKKEASDNPGVTLRVNGSLRGTLRINGSVEGIGSVAFSPDGKYLAATTENGVDLWNTSTLRSASKPATFGIGNGLLPLGAPTFSPDGTLLAVATDSHNDQDPPDGTIDVWRTDEAASRPAIYTNGSGTAFYSAAFSSAGYLAAATGNGVQLWYRGSYYQRTFTFAAPGDAATYSVAFSPDGKTLADTTSNGVWLANAATDFRNREPFTSDPTRYTISGIALNPGGSLLAIAYAGGAVQVWNIATGRSVLLQNPIGNNFPGTVAFSSDGKHLAAATATGMRVWDTGTLWNTRPSYASVPSTGTVRQMAYSPNGEYLAAADNLIQVWNTRNLKRRPRSLAVPEDTGTHTPYTADSVAFSPDSRLLAAASDDNASTNPGTGAIQEWHTGTFKQAVRVRDENYGDPAYSVEFSPDGSLLAVSGNGTTHLLNSATLDQAKPSLTGGVTGFTASTDGQVIGAAGGSGIALRDIATEQTVTTLPVPEGFGASSSIAFSANGKVMAAVAGLDPDEVLLWDVSYLGISLNSTASYLCDQLGSQSLTPAVWSRDAPGVSHGNVCP